MSTRRPARTSRSSSAASRPGRPRSPETTDLTLDATTTPAFIAGGWSSLDIPLTSFALPAVWDWGHIGQIVLSTVDAQLVLVDNIYWHR